MLMKKRTWGIVLAAGAFAALIAVAGVYCTMHLGYRRSASPSEGLVGVRVDCHRTFVNRQEPGIRYFTVLRAGTHGRIAQCEEFGPDEAEAYTVQLPYRLADGEIRRDGSRVTIRDPKGTPVDDDDLYAAAELIADDPHWIYDVKIFRSGEELLVSFKYDVNLITPSFLYYVDPERGRLCLLYRFEDMDIEAVKIVSPERLHGMG